MAKAEPKTPEASPDQAQPTVPSNLPTDNTLNHEPLQVTPEPKPNPWKIISIVLALIILLAGGYLYWLWQDQKSLNYPGQSSTATSANQSSSTTPTPSSLPTTSPTPPSSNHLNSQNPEETDPANGFVLKLSSENITQEYFELLNMLSNTFSPGDNTTYNYFLYTDTTSDQDINRPVDPETDYLNQQYYLLTDDPNVKASTYQASDTQIEVLDPQPDNLGQYLGNKKYCQQDSDCTFRSDFCTVGAYNQYHLFLTPWGCGPATYEELGDEITLKEQLNCDTRAIPSYDSLKCVNNSCQAVNLQAVCK